MPARLDELAVHDRLGLVRHLVHEGRGHERGDDPGPRLDERPQMLHALGRRRDDDHAPANSNAVERRHRRCGATEPHPGEIVAGEELVGLGGPGRDHDAVGAHLHELVRSREGHRRPVEQAERGMPLEDLDRRGRAGSRLERPDRVAASDPARAGSRSRTHRTAGRVRHPRRPRARRSVRRCRRRSRSSRIGRASRPCESAARPQAVGPNPSRAGSRARPSATRTGAG